ncbi:MAG: hypothetical protein IBX71_06090 [Candidatus Desulforudis sp.]|nr:hypothetical protein [Desulforudis sp.]
MGRKQGSGVEFVDYSAGVVTITPPDGGSLAYLLEITEKYLDLESIGFQGNLKMTMRPTGQTPGGIETADMRISGWFRNPDCVYIEMRITEADGSMEMKMYMDGLNLYMQEEDGPWMVMPGLGTQLPGVDPQGSAMGYDIQVIPPDVSGAIPVAASSITSQSQTG